MSPPVPPVTAANERIYAIGDVHGRLDLLGDLLGRIRQDSAVRRPAATTVVQLGDLVDRGPSSAELVGQFMNFTALSPRVIVLKGNHEAVMTEALTGNLRILRLWLDIGGDATLASWGIDPDLIAQRRLPELLSAARHAIPQDVIEWLESRPLSYRSGDYFLVHAGIRPGASLDRQCAEDMLWIRKGFVDSELNHGAVVVHGHSVSEDGPVVRANRIGIDTGAYRTGRLTALGLEADEQWILQTA